MCTKFYIGLAALVLLSSASGAGATMYVCKNSNGIVQFTNAPTLTNCKELKPKKKTSSFTKRYAPRVVNPGPASYDSHIRSASYRYDIDPLLIRAIIRVESDFDRYAVSKAGARGLMQLMPDTARELNVYDSFDPAQNIDGGTKYLRKLIDMFNGDLVLAIAAYNAGPTIVKQVNRIPHIPETRNYVKKVLVHYKQYRKLSAGLNKNSIRVGGLEIASAE